MDPLPSTNDSGSHPPNTSVAANTLDPTALAAGTSFDPAALTTALDTI
jgi:hypothetical protein